MIQKALIQPNSIAVFGASNNTVKPGYGIIQNLLNSQFQGDIYPVNPKEKNISGLKVYADIAKLPTTELAILAIPSESCLAVIEQLIDQKNTKAFIIISAGFSETGQEGRVLGEHLKLLIKNRHVSILGPNCIGLANRHYTGFFTTPPPTLHASGIDFVSASGALAMFIFDLAKQQGLRFSEVFTVGNSLQTGVEEIIEYWDTGYKPEKSSKVKLIYLEQVKNAPKIYKHLHSLAAKGCRTIVCISGKSEAGARASLSHTGAMINDTKALILLFQKAGAVVCNSRQEMVQLACIYQITNNPGNRAAVLTHAGGPGVLLTDALNNAGFSIPIFNETTKQKLGRFLHPGAAVSNPVDMLATGNKEELRYVLNICNDLNDIDFIVVIYGRTGLEDLFETYHILCQTISQIQKPVFIVTPSVNSAFEEIKTITENNQIVFFDEVILANNLKTIKQKYLSAIDEIIPAPPLTDNKPKLLPAEEIKERMDFLDIQTPNEWIIRNKADIASVTNFQVAKAAKALGIVHKTEVQGVILDIQSSKELDHAYNKLTQIEGVTGMLVQDMIVGTELFIGIKHHPEIGFTVHVGLGGIFLALINDTISQMAPLDIDEVKHMLNQLHGKEILYGYRNKPGIDIENLAAIIERCSRMFHQYTDIIEMDINPLIAVGDKFYAVDTRIIIQ